MRPLDLRSDTVTQPDERMRTAMAEAEVGDNVLDSDPTIRALEERAAGILGMPDALWTPSGTMANLVALSVHLRRGDSFLAVRDSHVLRNELGSAAWFAGGMPDILEHAGPGRPAPAAVRAATSGAGQYYQLRTRLLCLENTHNAAGGAITPPDEHALLVSAAREGGLLVHLDGARLWNAAVALGLPPAALTVGVDTVSACLSKGLGAPVGSVVCGSPDFVAEARRVRQMLGGGVRQGGILAAAGLVALERIDRLAEDHENARALAAGLVELGCDVVEPQTNIVLADVADVSVAVRRLADLGVHAGPMGGRLRLVTHCGISAADIRELLDRIHSYRESRQPI